jgi:16S rRNA (guanine527-N7)-methyltransferase
MPVDTMSASLLADLTGLRVSRETHQKLTHFVDLFEKWSKAMNLVANSTRDQMWHRHVADSLQLFKLSPDPKHWIDLGSGGGFPGVITAILLSEQSEGWVDLVESNHKKAGFLRTALMETGARGKVHAVRIDDAAKTLKHCDAISARALADLDLLFAYGEPWAIENSNLRFFLHKGRDYQSEVDNARGRWSFDLVIHPSVIEVDSVILEVGGLARSK